MIDYRVDGDGIAVVTWNVPGSPVNTLSDAATTAYVAAVDKALADPAVKGIVVTSAKSDFIAGADINDFLADRSVAGLEAGSRAINRVFRRLETAGKPMVAAINGTALGGGLELALACHYRIAADNPKTRIGLPGVTLGVLPGAGGTQRLPRLIGIRAAVPLMVEGTRLPVADALKLGIIHAVVPAGELLDKARAWILAGGKAEQPWDRKGFRVPGGDMRDPDVQEFMSVVIAKVHERTCGNYPAPLNILSCVYEGVSSPIEVGLDIESRYFGVTASTVQAENLIRSGFLALNDALKAGIVNAVVPAGELIDKAKAWILSGGKAEQPWDRKDFRYPGGDATSPAVRQIAVMGPVTVRAKTRGLMPAPERIVDIAVNSMRIGFDAALRM
jgi:3-hydroxyacyl-CoA dehydrogenase/enoyl-CoA hydratase/3-hydroxybutyryl-CoA epimerase